MIIKQHHEKGYPRFLKLKDKPKTYSFNGLVLINLGNGQVIYGYIDDYFWLFRPLLPFKMFGHQFDKNNRICLEVITTFYPNAFAYNIHER